MSEDFVRLLRRLALWTLVCAVSAVPSFIWANERFDRRAMAFGVTLFVLGFATTLVQGALLNVLLALFMTVVYVFQRLTMNPPATEARRGFDVVLPVIPAETK